MANLFDRMERALAEEGTVPIELAAEFLTALPRAEREAWLRAALDVVLRGRETVENLPDHHADECGEE